MATATRRMPVRLKFSDGQVTVTPQDMDTFVISAERATEACKEAIKRGERFQQFQEELLLPLHSWCVGRAPPVRACYMPMPVGSVRVFVVTGSKRFDFALAEEIAKLERDLHQAGWRVSISQLPAAEEDSLSTFFSPDGALEVYAQSERA
ncbi:MAG: hypothetical protein K2V38_03905 [Gemmataceae bacterium]|nr:hypothetical protein [Gemmataceae bacterium]